MPTSEEEKEAMTDSEDFYIFENNLKGMNIPREFVPAIEHGFHDGMEKAPWPTSQY